MRLIVATAAVAAATVVATLAASSGSSAATGWMGFQANNWPSADWRPYAASSPFNRRIAAKTRAHPHSRSYVRQILSWGRPAAFAGGLSATRFDYGHPTYWATTDDPLYTLRSSVRWGHPHIAGDRIRIPRGARPAQGEDRHMTVVQPDGWEYDFWRAQVDDTAHTLTYVGGARIRVDGSGLRAGATASGFGNLAGAIRAPELMAGRIDHALFVAIPCTASGTGFGFGARRPAGSGSAYVYPASGGGARCRNGESAPPLGSRLQLRISEKRIDALPIPRWKRAILRALKRYGAYIGDTGGSNLGVLLESPATYTSFQQGDPFVEFGQRQIAAGDNSVHLAADRTLFDYAGGVDWQRHLRVLPPPPPR